MFGIDSKSRLFGWFGRDRKGSPARAAAGKQLLAVLFNELSWDIVQGSDLSDRFSFDGSEKSFVISYGVRERVLKVLKVEVNPDSEKEFVIVKTGLGTAFKDTVFAYRDLDPKALHQHCLREIQQYGFPSQGAQNYAVCPRT